MSDDKSLLELIDLSQVNCLNENPEHTLYSILSTKSKNLSSAHLLSEADEQLLLTISFNQAVKIRKIAIKSTDSSKAPKSIKLLINRPSIGFEDVGDAVQDLELSPDDVASGKQISVRFVRFQVVTSLHIFVSANHGGEDETRIDSVDVIGLPVETTKDLSGLRKTEDET